MDPNNDSMENSLLPPLPCPETFRKRGNTLLQSHQNCNHPKSDRRLSSGFGGKLSASLDNLLDIRRSKRRINKKSFNDNFFTLLIQSSDQEEVIEKINFSLSQSFRSSVSAVLQRYKLNPLDLEFCLDGSSLPLSWNTDVNILAGTLIHVKHRDTDSLGRNRKSEKRNSTSGELEDITNNKTVVIRPRPLGRLLRPNSVAEIPKSLIKFMSDSPVKDKLDRLNLILSGFSSGNVPELPAYMDDLMLNYDVNLSKLESSWQEIVKNHETLSIREQKQQSAIWELLDTEVNFINQLRNLITIHLATFHSLHSDFFVEIDPTKLFSNLHEVYCANCVLWFEYLSKPLIHTREKGEPLSISLLNTAFQKINELLKPYSRFCTEVNDCRQNLQRHEKENILLKTFLQWASERDSSNRENFCDLLMKPFQRLCKYKPVLESIKKNTTDENDLTDLGEMINNVDSLVQQVNNAKHMSELLGALEMIENRIEAYDVVDPIGEDWQKHLVQYTKFSLLKTAQLGPDIIRKVIYEGVLKMKEGPKSVIEVACFLFTDLFLITKSSNKKTDKLKIYKPPVRLDKLIVINNGPPGNFACIVLNDFLCVNFVYVFTGKAEEIDLWVNSLKKTKVEFITNPQLHLSKQLAFYNTEKSVDIPKVEIESIPIFNRLLSDQMRSLNHHGGKPPDRASTFPFDSSEPEDLDVSHLKASGESLTSLTGRSPLTIRRKSREFTSPLVYDQDERYYAQTAPPNTQKLVPLFMYTSPNSSTHAISSLDQDSHPNNHESLTADFQSPKKTIKLLTPNNSDKDQDRLSRSLCDLTFIDGDNEDSMKAVSNKIKLGKTRETNYSEKVTQLSEEQSFDSKSSQLCA